MSKSRVFLFLMLCFVGGVGLRSFVFVEGFWVLLGFGIIAIAVLSFSREPRVLLTAAMVAAALFGMWRFGASEPAALMLSSKVGQKVEFVGRIAGDPVRKNGQQRFYFEPNDAPKEKILVSTRRYPEFSHGDTVRVSGTLKKPENFSDFDYVAYLAKEGVYFTVSFADVTLMEEGSGLKRELYALKRMFEAHISSAMPFPHSAYLNGILLGDDAEMSKELKEAFIATGTSHVLALSGYNITVIIGFVFLIFSSFIMSRFTVVWLSVTVVALFVVMTGASPSVVRAGVMGAALVLARYFGRQGRVINVLIFAAFAMILFNPKILVFDVAFQLSFLALLGLVYIYPWLKEKLARVPELWTMKESFIMTVSAQVAVLPLLLYHFHQFSLVSPLVNTLILPAIPYAMLFGFLTGIAGFVSGFLTQIFSLPTLAFVAYQLGVIQFFSQFSYATLAF